MDTCFEHFPELFRVIIVLLVSAHKSVLQLAQFKTYLHKVSVVVLKDNVENMSLEFMLVSLHKRWVLVTSLRQTFVSP